MLADPLLRLTVMKTYRGFPERLHHGVPHWVEPGALFQIRIALDCEKKQKALIDPTVGAGDSGFCKVLSLQDAVAYHAVSPDARSFARAALICARQIDERSHQRLETFS